LKSPTYRETFLLMRNFVRAYRLLNILSLDIVAGAIICAVFFARIFEVVVLPYGFISLGLTVWVIYTADHLLDAAKLQTTASTPRHRFHQRHFDALLVAALIAAVVDGLQLFYIRTSVFVGGIVLASIVVVYFFIQRRLTFLKESFGAILYAGGVLLIPVSLRQTGLSIMHAMFALQFFLVALTNLLLFSWFDYAPDQRDNHNSFARSFGEAETRRVIKVVFVVNALLTIFQVTAFPASVLPETILTAMNLVLLIIFVNKPYFESDDRYRLVGDAIFLLPLFYILI